jgi:hypothetical protein
MRESASALDRVDKTEDVVEDLGVIGVLLETHEFDLNDVETLVGVGHKIPQQVVHGKRLLDGFLARALPTIGSRPSVSMKRLILVAGGRQRAHVYVH